MRCKNDHWEEVLRPYKDRDKPHTCECGEAQTRMASRVYVTPEHMYAEHPIFGRVLKNDEKDPWEGSSLSGRGRPGPNYKSKKLFFYT